MVDRTTLKRIYLAGVVAFILTSLYLTYKMLVSPLWVKLILLVAAAVALYLPAVANPIAAFVDTLYCKLIYENDLFWELFYDFTVVMFPSAQLNQINYGYASLDGDGKIVDLDGKDEAERMSLQLYYRTLSCMESLKDFTGLTVLEVSSGRAGGIDFISRNFNVKKCIGLDLSSNNIDWCRKVYKSNPKLEFVLGNAETFADESLIQPGSIDIIISVDSAHLYPHFERFIHQCSKALKPNGYLCISDFMDSAKFPVREEILNAEQGLKMVQKGLTTENVLRAMDIDGERRNKLVMQHAPFFMRQYFKYQSGAKGSRIYNLLKGGDFTAGCWVLRKE